MGRQALVCAQTLGQHMISTFTFTPTNMTKLCLSVSICLNMKRHAAPNQSFLLMQTAQSRRSLNPKADIRSLSVVLPRG